LEVGKKADFFTLKLSLSPAGQVINDRDDFGDFLEEWKPDNSYRGGDTLPYDVLRDVAKEYKGL